MKLGLRIFILYLAIFIAGLYLNSDWIWTTLRTRYLESLEEPLVDSANLLAGLVEAEMARPDFTLESLGAALSRARSRPLDAQIYDLRKTGVDTQIYLTDATGMVLLDTRRPSAVGEDYSQFHDVKLTLEGRYGARASRRDPADPFSTALHIAAPIYREGRPAGVLTLVKPTVSVESFLQLARPAFLRVALLLVGMAALLGLAVSWWLTRPIDRLARYADGIRLGRHPRFPDLGRSEIADLGLALRRMQEVLEGKRYAEEYVQNLTHELKSPLSAIRGAAELLEEGMPPEQQGRFLANIRQESERIAQIVERMLELARLENRRERPEMEPVDLAAVVRTIAEAMEPVLVEKGVRLEPELAERLTVNGNPFLLHQGLENLIRNAVDFSPPGRAVRIAAREAPGSVTIAVADEGPGIPAFALGRIFERFYSLGRPDTGRKSTGLGLNFVREVAKAHGGSVKVGNGPQGGAVAELTLPSNPVGQSSGGGLPQTKRK